MTGEVKVWKHPVDERPVLEVGFGGIIKQEDVLWARNALEEKAEALGVALSYDEVSLYADGDELVVFWPLRDGKLPPGVEFSTDFEP